VSLIARHLERQGVATVVIGSARDIVEECGVPRFLFVDYPLGNPCGRPDAPAEQLAILTMALDVVDQAWSARTTVQAPMIWSDDESWRDAFMGVTDENREALAAAGRKRRAARAGRL
jgi:hypothetical protein